MRTPDRGCDISREWLEEILTQHEAKTSPDVSFVITSFQVSPDASTSNEHNIASTSNEHNIASTSNEHNIASTSNEHNIASTSNEHNITSTSNEHNIASTKCRSSGGSGEGVFVSAFNQLFLTVKKLCETVKSLSRQVATMTGVVGSGPAGTSPTLVGSSFREGNDSIRVMIREEAREMEERRKRKQSIIIKGFQAQTVDELIPVFNEVSTFLLGGRVPLTDIFCISKEKHIFRAKIEGDETRKNVLDNARKLHGSSNSDIYMNKDQTYKQRVAIRIRSNLQNGATGLSRPYALHSGQSQPGRLLPVPLSKVDPFPVAAARPNNNAAGQSENGGNGGAASGENRDRNKPAVLWSN
ncbi:hypothetical protein Pmani_014774 [Petrolisthes manimaculis]|uniref:Uncharacterized protein n=1 Tax=Petrolisthes manimaculis TaxID=1843537 RepID=A0AAE1PVT6_9EUCA|nr:hypothetical protein Pmani_014774 [Petrolisthes manimaculis]